MKSTPVISAVLVFGILFSCTHKIEGDKHPEMDELGNTETEQLEIRRLLDVDCIQYAKNGDVHVFGFTRDTVERKLNGMMWRYTKDFQIIDSFPLAGKHKTNYFIDRSSNVFRKQRGDQFEVLKFPNYEPELVPLHPAYGGAMHILSKEIQSHSRGKNYEQYTEMKKADKLDEVRRINDAVAKELAEYYTNQIPLDAIKYGHYYGSNFLLFMKDGTYSCLPATRMSNGKSSLGDYLEKKGGKRMYHHFHPEDWSKSMVNIETKNARFVQEKDFSVTDSKSTLDNWPNPGYTSGFYYFDLNMEDIKYQFKIKGGIRKTVVREVSKPRAKVVFLRAKKWHVIRVK